MRRPAAPFSTSTLQQEASRKLRFSSQTTMRVAQRLYENGYITYMRTDSANLSETALAAARAQATQALRRTTSCPASRGGTSGRSRTRRRPMRRSGRPATPSAPRRSCRASSPATSARSTTSSGSARSASQMTDAVGQTVVIDLGATTERGTRAVFRASGTVITSPGFLLAYESGRDEPVDDEEERRLPALAVGQSLSARSLEPQGHETTPPARYTEASLVRALEERGIGRPSTYASIWGRSSTGGTCSRREPRSYRRSSPSR